MALGPFSRWQSLTHWKVLLDLIDHVSIVKNCLVSAGPQHGSLRNLRLKMGVCVDKKAHPETVLILLLYIGRRHADGAVARGCKRQRTFEWYLSSARCRGLTNMSTILFWWSGWIAPPRPPFVLSHWESAVYRGVSKGSGSSSWRIPCRCPSVGAQGCVGSRFLAPDRKPPWLPWRPWSGPAPPRRTRKIHQLRWECTSVHRFALRFPAFRPGRLATEHRFPQHRYGCWWTDSVPLCAAYKPARFLGIPGQFVVWNLGHEAVWRV